MLKAQLPRWLGPVRRYMPIDGRPRPHRDPGSYADLLCGIHPVGTAADCIKTMATTMGRTGLRHLVLMVEGAGDLARTLENIARLGSDVLPALRQQIESHSSTGQKQNSES